MNCCTSESCCDSSSCCDDSCSPSRNFFTKEEKLEILKDYHAKLLKETQGVEERISELKNSKKTPDED